MKVVINETEKNEEIKYPCLMIGSQGTIVLMESRNGHGICISSSHDVFGFGHHSTDWDMKVFKPFKGSVTISND